VEGRGGRATSECNGNNKRNSRVLGEMPRYLDAESAIKGKIGKKLNCGGETKGEEEGCL